MSNNSKTGKKPSRSTTTRDPAISVETAIALGLSLTGQITGTQTLPVEESVGRIAQTPVDAILDQPVFDNAAMDGFAVATSDFIGVPPYTIFLEKPPRKDAPQATRIFTGAPIPDGADAVVMQEHCNVSEETVEFRSAPKLGSNIRRQGEDCLRGERLIESGTLLDARHIALLTAQGLTSVSVVRPIRVAYFSTGSELQQPGHPLSTGEIYNSNRFMLQALITEPFVEAIDLGAVPDVPEDLSRVIREASRLADVVLTTGGISAGDEDHLEPVVSQLGGTTHLLKLAIKPGKPVMVGTLGPVVFVALPGNPVAAYVTFMLLARPIIDRAAGMAPRSPRMVTVQSAFARTRRPGRTEYLPCRITGISDSGLPIVDAYRKAGAATLVPLARANGFAVIPPEAEKIDKGEAIRFIPLP